MVSYILMKPEHIAAYQHVLLTKKSFPVPAFADPIRKRLTKKGPDSYEEDADMKDLRMCADETLDAKPPAPYRPPSGSNMNEIDTFRSCQTVQYAFKNMAQLFDTSSTSSSLHTLHLDTGYWGWTRWWCIAARFLRLIFERKAWEVIGAYLKKEKALARTDLRIAMLRRNWSRQGQILDAIKARGRE